MNTDVLITAAAATKTYVALSTALFLARRNVDCIVVAAETAVCSDQPIELSARAMEVYRIVGLEDDIRRRARCPQAHRCAEPGTSAGAAESTSPTGPVTIVEAELTRILRRAAVQAGAEVWPGTELVSVDASVDASVDVDGAATVATVRQTHDVPGPAECRVSATRVLVTTGTDIAAGYGEAWRIAAVLSGEAGAALLDRPRESRESDGGAAERAPHVWLERAGMRFSTLDLCIGDFTLLLGNRASIGSAEAGALSVGCGVRVAVHEIGGELVDPGQRFLDAYGITAAGAALVTPDGYIGWRASSLPHDPAAELHAAVDRLLAR